MLDPEEYDDFVDDVRGEIEEKYGLIKDFHVPKPVSLLVGWLSIWCDWLTSEMGRGLPEQGRLFYLLLNACRSSGLP